MVGGNVNEQEMRELAEWVLIPYQEGDLGKLERPDLESWQELARDALIYGRLREQGPQAASVCLDVLETIRRETPEILTEVRDGRIRMRMAYSSALFSVVEYCAAPEHADQVVALLGWHEPTVEPWNDWRHKLLRTIGRIGRLEHVRALSAYAYTVRGVPYFEGLYGRVSVEEMRELDQQRIAEAIAQIKEREKEKADASQTGPPKESVGSPAST